MLAVRRPRTGRTASRQLHACGSGSEVSLCQLLEHRLVEHSCSEELLQPGVLALELLEPLPVVGLHAAVLCEPPSPGRLHDLQQSAPTTQIPSTSEKTLHLSNTAHASISSLPPYIHTSIPSLIPPKNTDP